MRVAERGSTIVLAGHWNAYILTPDWLGRKVFQTDTVKAEVAWGPGVAMRVFSGGAEISPGSGRVVIFALDSGPDGLVLIEQLAKRLLQSLPETPVSALGINHVFIEHAPQADTGQLFSLSDASKLPGDIPLRSVVLTRQFNAGEYTLNFKMARDVGEEEVKFDFNFHYDLASVEEPAELLTENIVTDRFNQAVTLLSQAYALSLDQDVQEE